LNTVRNHANEHLGRDLSYLRFPDIRLEPSVSITPSKIVIMNRMTVRNVNNSRLFSGGDWSVISVPFETYRRTNVRYITCSEILVDGKAVRDTAEFEKLSSRIKKNGNARKLRHPNDIECYLLDIQQMYFAIEKARKVSTQEERSGPKFGEEINFAIDRNLDLVKVDGGHHRFAAAVTLGLPVVPGQVRKIHSDCIPYIRANHGAGIGAVRNFILEVTARYQ
jgi:hypothetical protein